MDMCTETPTVRSSATPGDPGNFHYCDFQNHGTNPNPNPNPYGIPVGVPPNDITGVQWLEMSNNVYHDRRVAVAMTADGRGWLCNFLRLDVRGTAVAFAADFRGLPW